MLKNIYIVVTIIITYIIDCMLFFYIFIEEKVHSMWINNED